MLRLLVAIALVTAALSAPSWTNQLKAAQDQAAKTTELASSTSSTTTTASPTAAPSYSCNKYTHNLAQMYTCSNVPKCCRGYQAKGQASDMIQCMPDARNMNVTCPTAAPSSLAPSTAPPTSITEQCHCPDCFKNTTMDDLVTLNMLWVGESKNYSVAQCVSVCQLTKRCVFAVHHTATDDSPSILTKYTRACWLFDKVPTVTTDSPTAAPSTATPSTNSSAPTYSPDTYHTVAPTAIPLVSYGSQAPAEGETTYDCYTKPADQVSKEWLSGGTDANSSPSPTFYKNPTANPNSRAYVAPGEVAGPTPGDMPPSEESRAYKDKNPFAGTIKDDAYAKAAGLTQSPTTNFDWKKHGHMDFRDGIQQHEMTHLGTNTQVAFTNADVGKEVRIEGANVHVDGKPRFVEWLDTAGQRAGKASWSAAHYDCRGKIQSVEAKKGGKVVLVAAFTPTDIGKTIEIQGDTVKVEGVQRQITWGDAEHHNCHATITGVQESLKGNVTIGDGSKTPGATPSWFQNPAGAEFQNPVIDEYIGNLGARRSQVTMSPNNKVLSDRSLGAKGFNESAGTD